MGSFRNPPKKIPSTTRIFVWLLTLGVTNACWYTISFPRIYGDMCLFSSFVLQSPREERQAKGSIFKTFLFQQYFKLPPKPFPRIHDYRTFNTVTVGSADGNSGPWVSSPRSLHLPAPLRLEKGSEPEIGLQTICTTWNLGFACFFSLSEKGSLKKISPRVVKRMVIYYGTK